LIPAIVLGFQQKQSRNQIFFPQDNLKYNQNPLLGGFLLLSLAEIETVFKFQQSFYGPMVE
jgi:hypothetical protein